MPVNPFRKARSSGSTSRANRARIIANASAASSTTNASEVVIAAGGAAVGQGGSPQSSEQQQQQQQQQNMPLSPRIALPPESDYRTSLIMPHLTRRFTLLRAPDGSMVTPDAMRAHLRAQRARARATGAPGTQCFLTEEEEDEIIDQLKRQTRLENAQGDPHENLGESSSPALGGGPDSFGGTDGFGGWAQHRSVDGEPPARTRIDSLTESLSTLPPQASRDETAPSLGGFFTSRSSTRDLAYMSGVEKSRARRGGEGHVPTTGSVADDSRIEEEGSEEEDMDGSGMPGDLFSAPSHTAKDVPSVTAFPAPDQDERDESSVDHSRGTDQNESVSDTLPPPSRRQLRQSELLTSLSPEAFNRVSTALEEVYGMVQGRADDTRADDSQDLQESESGSIDEGEETTALPYHDTSKRTRSHSTLATANQTHIQEDTNAVAGEEEEEEEDEEEEEIIDGVSNHIVGRRSVDSDERSFTSAHSDVNSSVLGAVRAVPLEKSRQAAGEAMAGIGAAAMTTQNSDQDLGTIHRPNMSQPNVSTLPRNSNSSSGTASQSSQSSIPSPRQRIGGVSLDPANGRIRRGSAVPTSNTFISSAPSPASVPPDGANGTVASDASQDELRQLTSPLMSATAKRSLEAPGSSSPAPLMSPLASGFNFAALAGAGGARSASAAATAAGVAAASYVAQAQADAKAQRQQPGGDELLRNDSGQSTRTNQRASIVAADQGRGSVVGEPPFAAAGGTKPSPDPAYRPEVSETAEVQSQNLTSQQTAPTSEITLGALDGPNTSLGAAGMPGETVRPWGQQSTPNQTSAAAGEVLSANAIAARSQRYFPKSSKRTLSRYADGFKPPTSPEAFAQSSPSLEGTPRQLGHAKNPSLGSSSDAASPSAFAASQSGLPSASAVPISAAALHSATNTSKSRDAVSSLSSSTPPQPSSNMLSFPSPAKSDASPAQALDKPVVDALTAQKRKAPPPALDISPQSTSVRASGRSMATSDGGETDELFEEEDEEEDVWARVARNTAGQNSQRDARDASDDFESLPNLEQAPVSIDELREIQDNLVRSASAKKPARSAPSRSAATTSSPTVDCVASSRLDVPSVPKILAARAPATSSDYVSAESDPAPTQAEAKANKGEENYEKGRMSAERAPVMQNTVWSLNSAGTPSLDAAALAFQGGEFRGASTDSSNNSRTSKASAALQRETSSRSSRSQVMYDVTTSHRPTSPPPRTHKASLTNLPSLQDLQQQRGSLYAKTSTGHDRNSASLASMVEESSRVHDALVDSDDSAHEGFGTNLGAGASKSHDERLLRHDAIPEEEGADDYEEIQHEDGFGGFFVEKRKLPRSKSHDMLSSTNGDGTVQSSPVGLASPFTPKSFHSEPSEPEQKGIAGEDVPPTWSQLPPEHTPEHQGSANHNKEASLHNNVAAQAQAATEALKGADGQGPAHTRSKSLSKKARKQLARNISQPELITTTQRMEHTQSIPKPDSSLRRKMPMPPSDIAILPRSSSRAGGMSRSLQSQRPAPERSTSRVQLSSMSRTSSQKSIATDYRNEGVSGRRQTSRRSSSFGHPGHLPSDSITSSSNDITANPLPQPKAASPGTPQSTRSQGGLSRLMTRLRTTRKGIDAPHLVEPYLTMEDSSSRNARGQSNTTLPRTNALGSVQESATAVSSPGRTSPSTPRLPVLSAGATSLSVLLDQPPRSSRHLEQHSGGATSSAASFANDVGDAPVDAGQLTPGPPAHARVKAPSPRLPPSVSSETIQRGNPPFLAARASSPNDASAKPARDTVVRRTIIVSTYEASAEDRRKSSMSRKASLRKAAEATNVALAGRSTDASGTRRQPSVQGATAEPAVPLPTSNMNTLDVPSQPGMRSRDSAPSLRTSIASGYGASLYDMYVDNEAVSTESPIESQQQHQSYGAAYPQAMLSVSHPASRQSALENGAGSTRHIEVTERADGSVVWQVIAGLAERSSTYSASIGYEAELSRRTSDMSQYSFQPNRSSHASVLPSGHNGVLGNNEDGRSLFARPRGTKQHRKSFSFDGQQAPPMPAMPAEMDRTGLTSSTQGGETRVSDAVSLPATESVGFDMETTPGEAATRIVYTSDAELAGLLESLAGPEKSSAKFAFQRVGQDEADKTGVYNIDERLGTRTGTPTPAGGSVNQPPAKGSEPSQQAAPGNGNARKDQLSNGSGRGGGRPVSIVTEAESAGDPTGALRQQRFKIEAEIYSLLQRDGDTA